MKDKKIIIITILGVLAVISSVIFINREYLRETIFDIVKPQKERNFKLEFENKSCNSKEIIVYTYPDNHVIYSKCGDIYYIEGKDKIPLAEALDKKYITIQNIYDKMKFMGAIYDGGSELYKYTDEFNNFANTSFQLELCNKVRTCKDQTFLSIDSKDYKCMDSLREKDFKISFEDKTCNLKEKVIYTYSDGKKIYSTCGEIYYEDDDHKNITLGEAIDKEYIHINHFPFKMNLIKTVFDEEIGYTKTNIYEYNKNKKTISNTSFKLEICNKLNGERVMNQIFTSYNNKDYKCA